MTAFIVMIFGLAAMSVAIVCFRAANEKYDSGMYILGGVFGFFGFALIGHLAEIAF